MSRGCSDLCKSTTDVRGTTYAFSIAILPYSPDLRMDCMKTASRLTAHSVVNNETDKGRLNYLYPDRVAGHDPCLTKLLYLSSRSTIYPSYHLVVSIGGLLINLLTLSSFNPFTSRTVSNLRLGNLFQDELCMSSCPVPFHPYYSYETFDRRIDFQPRI